MWGLQRRDDNAEPEKLPPAADALTVQDILDRIAAEHADEGMPSPVLEHIAPREPISEDQAHTLMQRHRACSLVTCPAKLTAYTLLVDRGLINPHPPHGRLEPGLVRRG